MKSSSIGSRYTFQMMLLFVQIIGLLTALLDYSLIPMGMFNASWESTSLPSHTWVDCRSIQVAKAKHIMESKMANLNLEETPPVSEYRRRFCVRCAPGYEVWIFTRLQHVEIASSFLGIHATARGESYSRDLWLGCQNMIPDVTYSPSLWLNWRS